MQTFKSITPNKGTTIILDDCQQAIEKVNTFFVDGSFEKVHSVWGYDSKWIEDRKQRSLKQFRECEEALSKGNKEFKDAVEEKIEEYTNLVDNLYPSFKKSKSGFDVKEEGDIVSMERVANDEEQFMLRKKESDFEIKPGKGDGAYRFIINTDVWWGGTPIDNCAIVGTMIVLCKRYAPVEVWIQQGWLGGYEEDGVTLFKLDYETSLDVTNLAFWICHPFKDCIFSYLVNKALGRNQTTTSHIAELECDIMFRGDLMEGYGFGKIHNKLYTEQQDIVAKYIADTSYKILTQEEPPEITE